MQIFHHQVACLLLTIALGQDSNPAAYATYRLFATDGQPYRFALGVKEYDFQKQPPHRRNLLDNSFIAETHSERCIQQLIEHLRAGDSIRVKELIADADNSPIVAFLSYLEKYYRGADEVMINRIWTFGVYRSTLLSVSREGIEDMQAFSTTEHDDRAMITHDWGSVTPVRVLWNLAQTNINNGLIEKVKSDQFAHSIVIASPNDTDEPVHLYFDGQSYGQNIDWVVIEAERGGPDSVPLVEILAEMNRTSIENFIDLFENERRRTNLRAMLENDPVQLRSIRAFYLEDRVQLVFEMQLGSHLVYYYRSSDKAGELKTLILEDSDETTRIAEESINPNLKSFLISDFFKEELLAYCEKLSVSNSSSN